uniref:29.2 kDa salivary protein n=1 Tax=Lutzomyia longipalpis TaxID=7200 RepID=Q5WPT9_LUTLO|nr:29.2 kDa salivary protein [Lutzomyia longipalpis]
MIKEVFSLALLVALAQCANEIPINRQGKDYPVPIIDPNKSSSDDYFDDRFYPDIDDEGIAEAPKDNRGKSRGGGAAGAREGRLGTNGAKPGQGGTRPGQGGTRPGQGGTRPGQGGTRPGQGGTRPGQGRTKPAQGTTRPAQGTRNPGSVGTKEAQDASKQGQGKRRPGQVGGKRPGQANAPNAGTRKQQKGSRGVGRPDLSRYKDAPAKFVFKSPDFSGEGKTPTVNYFRTKKKEHIVTRGSPNDEFVLEILDGDPTGLGLKSETIGKDTRLVLENPNGNSIVARVKIYKNGYSG